MKSSFDILIDTRAAADVLPENPYMFAIHGTTESTMKGCKILRKYSKLCNAKEPENLTSTRLRKHVTTMSQLMYLTPTEMDQVAKFMGHKLDVHNEFYKLPQNTVQVAKMSNLLILMEKGDMTKIAGKTISDINMSDNEEMREQPDRALNEAHSSAVQCNHGNIPTDDPVLNGSNDTKSYKEEKNNAPKKEKDLQKHPWTQEERSAILRHFEKYILLKKVPNKEECDKCLKAEPVLNKRCWSHVKFYVKNVFPK